MLYGALGVWILALISFMIFGPEQALLLKPGAKIEDSLPQSAER
jgi:hypothetical protein